MLAVNIFNFDSLRVLSETFEAANIPVIAQVSARFFRTHSPEAVVGWKAALGNRRLWLHLDHCPDLVLLRACAKAGFDSVMFDGSALPLRENIARSSEATKVVRRLKKRVLVECEIGHVGGVEDGIGSEERRGGIPRVDDVVDYHRQVQPDLLAVGFGNMHGHYRGDEFFDLELMKAVARSLPNVPLVLHGGSGMHLAVVKRLVSGGHCKLNISTDLKVAWMASLREAGAKGSPLEACDFMEHSLRSFFLQLKEKYSGVFPC